MSKITEAHTPVTAPITAGSDTRNDWPIGYNKDLQGALQLFGTSTDRDGWSTAYPSRRFGSTCLVLDADGSGLSKAYKWTGTKPDGTDGDWGEIYFPGGIVVADTGGALTTLRHSVIFGPEFNIQEAGDQGAGVLVTLKPGAGGSSAPSATLTIGKQWGDYKTISNVNEIELLYPLEVTEAKSGPNTVSPGVAMLNIRPGVYEDMHSAACLLKLGRDQIVRGGIATPIYCNTEIVPMGMWFSLNQAHSGVNIQDNLNDDTSATGGQLTEILASVSFFDSAPVGGTVKAWLEYKDPASPLPAGILKDINGNIMAVERQYAQGDKLQNLIISGAVMATGQAPVVLKVETSFPKAQEIVLNPSKTMVCINQFKVGYQTSLARMEFMDRLGVQIIPEIHHFDGNIISLRDSIRGLTMPEATIAKGEGEEVINLFGLNNLTPAKVQLKDGFLTVQDTGKDILDFYVDTVLDSDKTIMLRGKELRIYAAIKNPTDAFNVSIFSWAGKPNKYSSIFTARSNDSILIDGEWTEVNTLFVAENPSGTTKTYTMTGTVPNNSTNIAVIVYPVVAQVPCELDLSELQIGVSPPFVGYLEKYRYNDDEIHLGISENYAEFVLNNQKYMSLRYTINNTPATGLPMPVGKLAKGKAPVVRDGTVNVVPGSGDPENDGGIKFLKDGEASISKSYNLRNETGSDSVVTFWDVLIDVDGNEIKIPSSEKEFTIKANTGAPGVIVTIPAYIVEVEAGQRVAGRALADKSDGAYVQTDTANEYLVQTIIDFKELVKVP